jgi:hypothetical protein
MTYLFVYFFVAIPLTKVLTSLCSPSLAPKLAQVFPPGPCIGETWAKLNYSNKHFR